jgi:CheY-like chemotaxis protein
MRMDFTSARGHLMKRVLVVDDDPLVSLSIRLTLDRHGFETVLADGGVSGLHALEASRFDVMIVDIFMPEMRGFESVRVFHQRAPDVPLIAISGYAFAQHTAPAPDFLRMALELGATRCLRKPFTPAALLAVIGESLAEASALRRPDDLGTAIHSE